MNQDEINQVVMQCLKVTTSSCLTTGQAMEVAMRLFIGVALDETEGDPIKAAKLLKRAAKHAVRSLQDPTIKISPAVKDGKTLN